MRILPFTFSLSPSFSLFCRFYLFKYKFIHKYWNNKNIWILFPLWRNKANEERYSTLVVTLIEGLILIYIRFVASKTFNCEFFKQEDGKTNEKKQQQQRHQNELVIIQKNICYIYPLEWCLIVLSVVET